MLLLIAGILQLIMSVTVLGLMIALLNEVNEGSYCDDHYVACTADTDGTNCVDWYGDDAMCYKNEVCVGTNVDDYYNDCYYDGTTLCAPPPPRSPTRRS